jgi:DNA-binding response OmpR family regulator
MLEPAPCILVADDEPDVRDLIREILQESGFEVVTASNGQQAMERLESLPIDLLIVDLVMPEQEGLETIRMLRKRRPEVKILAISGSGALYLRVARLLGAQTTLQKPFTVDALVEKVTALLDGAGSPAPHEAAPFRR